jgi:hypothetical protein
MGQSSKNRKFKLQLFNRSALVRLAVLFMVLLCLLLWAWFTIRWMPERSYQSPLPPATQEELALKRLLQQDIQKLAAEIGARNTEAYDNLNAAGKFLETALSESGYSVRRQVYKIDNQSYFNLEVERLGTEKPEEVVVVGGHYDSAFNSPGANDNATGAVATLELARRFSKQPTNRTIRFVEFTNEEPPFFWTENMGSLVYAKQLKARQEKVVAMLSLETIGYFSDNVGSQKYPFPIGLLYPNKGNFIAFIGNLKSGDLARRSIASFRRHAQFPSEGAVLPGWIPGVGWSDQWSFWQQGYPGIMVTDTAPYRYPYYHQEDDTLDKIDFDKLARVVSGLADVIFDLAI